MDLHAQPDRAFRTIHVTGTKGKGSVSRMLAVHLRVTGERLPLAPCHVAEPGLANMVAGGQE